MSNNTPTEPQVTTPQMSYIGQRKYEESDSHGNIGILGYLERFTPGIISVAVVIIWFSVMALAFDNKQKGFIYSFISVLVVFGLPYLWIRPSNSDGSGGLTGVVSLSSSVSLCFILTVVMMLLRTSTHK